MKTEEHPMGVAEIEFPVRLDPSLLTVKTLLPQLSNMSRDELQAVLGREVEGRNRVSVVRYINNRLVDGEEELNASDTHKVTIQPAPPTIASSIPHAANTTIRYCAGCGGRLEGSAAFCGACGAATGRASTPSHGMAPSPQLPPQSGAHRPGTNSLAVASLVLGILWLGGLGSLLAWILGRSAKAQIKQSGESGEGMATAGIVLGIIGVVLVAAVIGMAYLENSAADKFSEVGNCIDYGIGC